MAFAIMAVVFLAARIIAFLLKKREPVEPPPLYWMDTQVELWKLAELTGEHYNDVFLRIPTGTADVNAGVGELESALKRLRSDGE